MNTIILLHGALGSKDQFSALIKLLEQNFQVHILNFSGHGGLPIPVDGFSMSLFENDVLKYMEAHVIDSAFIFGYSMGGYVGLSLAANHPAKVKALFTLATKLDWNPESASKESAMLNPEIIQQKVPDFAKQLQERHQPADWKNLLSATSDFMMQLGNAALDMEVYKSIQCPVRLSVGDRDKMVSINETMNVYKAIPKGSLLVLPQTPHPFELTDQSRIASELKLFFT